MNEKSDNISDTGMKMYAVESVILRISIVLGMVAAVVTVLYFTPMPGKYFLKFLLWK